MRVYKWTVKVNDQWHPIGGGQVVLVDCQHSPESVQVWTVEGDEVRMVGARVYGTGQELPENSEVVGSVSALRDPHPLVWHVVRGVLS